MAQLLNLRLPPPPPPPPFRLKASSSYSSVLASSCSVLRLQNYCDVKSDWNSLRHKLACKPRIFCFFSGNNKQEQAKKALEGALDGKKIEYEKWDKEMTKKEEAGSGNGGGGGGWWWFGGRGWSGDDWREAQLASLTILGLFLMFLVVAKGDVLFAVVFNALLFVLRGTRKGFSTAASKILKIISPNRVIVNPPVVDDYTPVSAKESVLKKWGGD